MAVETPVFGGDKCLANVLRDRGQGHIHAPHVVQAAHRLLESIVYASPLRRVVRADGLRIRAAVEATGDEPGVVDEHANDRQSEQCRLARVTPHPASWS